MTKKKTSKDKGQAGLEEFYQKLKNNKLKMTGPRKLIIEALYKNHGPYFAEEIHKKFLRSTCDIATVYRCVTQLEAANILKRCEFGDGMTRYELAQQEHPHHHHHLICTACKRVEVLENCDIDLYVGSIVKKRGYAHVYHMLEFFGVCKDCQI